MNYTIGDFIIQLKNAALARKKELVTPYANIKQAIAKVLIKEGFLDSVKEEMVEGKRVLHVTLRYQRRKPALTDVSLVSKPSLRIYIAAGDILRNQGRAATAILSTNIGVLTGKEAVKKGVGGELLFKVW
ncbi:MAG TPA: 30S ribosomal protein S8 [Methylomirabilota bacterium]|nr:30S ribosomal protein S8 [Methylomirabilota bacterium]